VVVVVPPLMERQRGFGGGVATVCRLAARIGAAVEVFGEEHGLKTLQGIAAAERARVDAGWVPYDDWEDILNILARHLVAEDMLVLLSPRSGQLAWDRTVERLPAQLARRFPSHNAVLVYPPDPDADGEGMASARSEPRDDAFPDDGIFARAATDALTQGAGTVGAAIATLVRRRFGDGPLAQHVVRALEKNEAVELAEGVWLLHAHVEGLAEAALLLAAGRFEHPGRPPARIVALLASPLDSPPERHLRLLAAFARIAQDETRIARLAAAADAASLRAALRGDPVTPHQ